MASIISWIAVLKLLLTLAVAVFKHIEDKKVMADADARAINKLIGDLDARVQASLNARDRVARDATDKLREDDGFRIDLDD